MKIFKTAVLLSLYGMFSRIVSLSRELRSLSKASAKVQQIFKLQNFFGSFFWRIFDLFHHLTEYQCFDDEKNFQLFWNIFGSKAKMGIFAEIRPETPHCIFSKIGKKIHKTCYKKKIVLKIALTLHAIYRRKKKTHRATQNEK